MNYNIFEATEIPTVDNVVANYDKNKATLGRGIDGNKYSMLPKEKTAAKRKAAATPHYTDSAQRLGKKIAQGLLTLSKNGWIDLEEEIGWLKNMARGYTLKVKNTSKLPADIIYHTIATMFDEGQWEEIQDGNDVYYKCFADDWSIRPRFMKPRRKKAIAEDYFPY